MGAMIDARNILLAVLGSHLLVAVLPRLADASGPAVPMEPFQRVWSTNKVVLLGLGDSVTAGFGATAGHSYLELLVQNDDSAYKDMAGRELKRVFPRLEPLNRALSGTTSQEHIKVVIPRLPTFSNDVKGIIVLTTGGNDLIHDYGRSAPRDGAMYGCTYEQAKRWSQLFQARLEAILDGVKSKFPGGCEIFLANIFDPTDGVGDLENSNLKLPRWPEGLKALALFNGILAEASHKQSHVHLVDFHSHFLGHGIHHRDRRNPHYRKDDPRYWYFDNLEDPNDRGYDAIRRLFLLEMIQVFAPSKP